MEKTRKSSKGYKRKMKIEKRLSINEKERNLIKDNENESKTKKKVKQWKKNTNKQK